MAKTFHDVKNAFLDRFVERKKLQDSIVEAIEALLDLKNFSLSVYRPRSLCNRAPINDETRFVVLRMAVKMISRLATFVLHCGLAFISSLKEMLKIFTGAQRLFDL